MAYAIVDPIHIRHMREGVLKPTRRDSTNRLTVLAVAHLVVAQDARSRYDAQLRIAIDCFGDVTDGHYISGVYAEHFPGYIKERLRFHARFIGEQVDLAAQLWRQAGRHIDTFWPYMHQSRLLEDGRLSYY